MKDKKEPKSVEVLPAWQRVVFATADIKSFPNFSGLLPAPCQEPLWCMSVREVMSVLSVHDIAVVVCSATLADGSFRDLFRVLHLARWHVPVIVVFPAEQPEQESEAILLGAFGYLTPESEPSKIRQILSRALVESSQPNGLEETVDPPFAATWTMQ